MNTKTQQQVQRHWCYFEVHLEGTSADLGVDTHQRYDNAGDMGSVELIKFSAYDHDLYICFVCDD